ncbi:ribosomal protein S20 [Peptostreptococcaceae bacterium oral taxon 113 str. W5053]|nr:ribosomal protein S20 [Peptostreptococcaceae bacterium oral taxon 113 str. W5053]
MANIKSAIKRIKTTEKRTLRNKSTKSELKTLIRKFEGMIDAGSMDEAKGMIRVIDKKLKRAASKNVIHKNAASKKLSKLAKKLNIVKEA